MRGVPQPLQEQRQPPHGHHGAPPRRWKTRPVSEAGRCRREPHDRARKPPDGRQGAHAAPGQTPAHRGRTRASHLVDRPRRKGTPTAHRGFAAESRARPARAEARLSSRRAGVAHALLGGSGQSRRASREGPLHRRAPRLEGLVGIECLHRCRGTRPRRPRCELGTDQSQYRPARCRQNQAHRRLHPRHRRIHQPPGTPPARNRDDRRGCGQTRPAAEARQNQPQRHRSHRPFRGVPHEIPEPRPTRRVGHHDQPRGREDLPHHPFSGR